MPTEEQPAPDWDAVAAAADDGLAATLGRLQRMHESGTLQAVIVAYMYRGDDGSMYTGFTWEPENHVLAVGLWHDVAARLVWPQQYQQAPDDQEEGPHADS